MTPTMLIETVREPDLAAYDLSALRTVFYGSSPMDAQWIKRVLAAFEGVEIIQSYGLTETAPLLTVLPMADHRRAIETGDHAILRSCGRPLARGRPPELAGEVERVNRAFVQQARAGRREATFESYIDYYNGIEGSWSRLPASARAAAFDHGDGGGGANRGARGRYVALRVHEDFAPRDAGPRVRDRSGPRPPDRPHRGGDPGGAARDRRGRGSRAHADPPRRRRPFDCEPRRRDR